MAAILAHREVAPLLPDEHFSVDSTLVKAWASMKSFQPKAEDAPPEDESGGDRPPGHAAADHSEAPSETDPMPCPSRQARNAEVDFRGEKRSNATHASTTDPDARLYRKSAGEREPPRAFGRPPAYGEEVLELLVLEDAPERVAQVEAAVPLREGGAGDRRGRGRHLAAGGWTKRHEGPPGIAALCASSGTPCRPRSTQTVRQQYQVRGRINHGVNRDCRPRTARRKRHAGHIAGQRGLGSAEEAGVARLEPTGDDR